MSANDSAKMKRPVGVERAFPWRCTQCSKNEVVLKTISYDAEIRHDGRLYKFTVPNLEIPICRACGKKVFSEQVDDQINVTLRSELHLLTPRDMRAALERVGMTQKETAERLGVAEATLSRWLSDTQIQSRAMDNLLRIFFAFPQVRNILKRSGQNPRLGSTDLPGQATALNPGEIPPLRQDASWLDAKNGKRAKYQKAQEVVKNARTTWGKKVG